MAAASATQSDAASRVDADLVARAYRKTMDRQELTRDERSALRRHEKDKEERLRWQYYNSIPQKHWRQMSGRQTKVLNEQADRYGIPFGGPFISLPKVVRALHDFLADNAIKLARDEDPLMQGGGSPALERYREERASMARMDRLEREGQLIPRDLAREALGRVAAVLRSAGDALQREHGAGAVEILNESLDDAQREIERFFGDADMLAAASHNLRVHPTRDELIWFLRQARTRRIRTMREFAEQEIVIPDGPYSGRRFRCSRQPYTGLWFDAVDSGLWSRCVATGPTQSGKTLACFVTPLLYHLFERGETVICGLPDMDMAGDKMREDILPAIEQSRYRDLMPRHGGGSRGGRVESLQFMNGATLKFMSGGGSDKSRAGFTARVVVITETDGMDRASATSREADKVSQLEARTRAYGARKRVYMECTVSSEEGRTWQEYTQGTQSRIVIRCPLCHAWVSPEREHLTGWQGAETQAAARSSGRFSCPDCGQVWSGDDLAAANRQCQLLHRGQTIEDDGLVAGELPETDTLGFRWSAVNKLFLTPGDLAADEWRASRSADEENAERELRQFVWCLPTVKSKWEETSIKAHELASRIAPLARGILPKSATRLTAAIDLGKYLCHWIVVAWSERAVGHVVDYGRLEVATDDLGVEQGLLVALREFKALVQEGWPQGSPEGERILPGQVWIDAGYMAPVVYTFCREAGERFRPAIGRGAAQQRKQWYNRPTKTGAQVKQIGEGYHINRLRAEGLLLCEIDADYWKTWIHQRLSTPLGAPGAMTLFQASPQEHLALAKHLTAEVKTEEFVAGKGVVVTWERLRRQNHWFDALYNASAAGYYCGVRLVAEPPKQPGFRPTLEQIAEMGRRPTAQQLAQLSRPT